MPKVEKLSKIEEKSSKQKTVSWFGITITKKGGKRLRVISLIFLAISLIYLFLSAIFIFINSWEYIRLGTTTGNWNNSKNVDIFWTIFHVVFSWVLTLIARYNLAKAKLVL